MLNEKAQGTGLTFKPSGLENAGLLQIVHKGVTVVSIDLCDGSVTYGEGYAADEAAKVFWEVVEQLLPIGICDG